MAEHPSMKGRGLLSRIWRLVVTPSSHYSFGAILLYGIAVGVVFWGSFHWAIELSNTETFCISCHEHANFTLPEVQKSAHYNNIIGIRANCYDCHVPRDWVHKVATKVYVTRELFQHMAGALDTRDKYEAKRLVMATDVWRRLRESNSRECKNCHDYEAMNLRQQEGTAARQHRLAASQGIGCIDCHMGIAHKLPVGAPERHLLSEGQR